MTTLNVFIKDTGTTAELPNREFILNNDVSQAFVYDDDAEHYECTQDDFDWWLKVASDHADLDQKMADLIEIHGHDAVYAVTNDAFCCDLEDQAYYVNQALFEAFAKS